MDFIKATIFVILIVVLSACQNSGIEENVEDKNAETVKTYTAAHSKAEVYAWGRETVSALEKLYPESFKVVLQSSGLSPDFDFKSLNLKYDKTINDELNFTSADTEFLRDAGVICVIAEACGLAWDEDSFLPMMQWQRRFLPPEIRSGSNQIAVTGVLHGFAMGTFEDWVEANDLKCDEVEKILNDNLFSDRFPGY